MGAEVYRLRKFIEHVVTARRRGHGIHSPFVYALCENVLYNPHPHYIFRELDNQRKQLKEDKTLLETGGFGAGSKAFTSTRRSVAAIARHGISSKKQSELLYRLANYLKCKSALELGTSLGLNALYLASQNPGCKVISLEGSSELHAYAAAQAKRMNLENLSLRLGKFRDLLPECIRELDEPCLVYVDGDHSYESTVGYFDQLRSLARGRSVFVFDDIYWSKGMTKAWEKIKSDPAVRLSIDLYYMGLVFFSEDFRNKVSVKLLI